MRINFFGRIAACLLSALFICGMINTTLAQSLAINTDGSPADTSAILDVKAINKGILIPRMTEAQRLALPLPATGLMVYQTDGEGRAGFYANLGSASQPSWLKILNQWEDQIIVNNYLDSTVGLYSRLNSAKNKYAAIVGLNLGQGPAGEFVVDNKDFNFTGGLAALRAFNTGKGEVFAGLFGNINTASTYPALQAYTNGVASAIRGFNRNDSTGPAGDFFITKSSNTSPAISSNTKGIGHAARFNIDNNASTNTALWAETNGPGSAAGFILNNSQSTGSAAFAISKGTNGFYTQVDNATTNGAAIVAQSINTSGGAGSFEILNANNSKTAFISSTSGTGNAGAFNIFNANSTAQALFVANNGKGNAAAFIGNNSGVGVQPALYVEQKGGAESIGVLIRNTNSGNNYPAVHAESEGAGSGVAAVSSGSGTALVATANGTGDNIAFFQSNWSNRARIDRTGKGFFNGGTQNSGADVAEAFDVEGDDKAYEPGDVLVISTTTDRRVEKSNEPYSPLVAGVYATKPGVLLTEKDIEDKLDGMVPMGVIGVIPTKVSTENGPIRRGDMLVSSSVAGYAMKGTDKSRMLGAVIGKALEDFNGDKGLIKVLVNVK